MEVLPLSTTVQESRNKYETVLLELEIQKVANSTTILQNVPTLPNDVRTALRYRGLPVRYFGENLMNIRTRLRYEIAKEYVISNKQKDGISSNTIDNIEQDDNNVDDEEEVTKYTRAGQVLIEARKNFTTFSILRAKERLYRERLYRHVASYNNDNDTTTNTSTSTSSSSTKHIMDNDDNDNESTTTATTTKKRSLQMITYKNELQSINDECFNIYKSLRQITLEGTQYGDTRSLSCISVCHYNSLDNNSMIQRRPLIVTASWTGAIQLWDGQSSALNQLSYKANAHTDRIMGIATSECNTRSSIFSNNNGNSDNSNTTQNGSILIATTSIDMTAKLWKVQNSNDIYQQQQQEEEEEMKHKDTSDTVKDDDTTAMLMDDDNEQRPSNEDIQERINGSVPSSSLSKPQDTTWTINETGHYVGHKARLCRVAFHPMKQHIATTSFDNTWRLWDINRTSTSTATFSSELLLQDGHCSQVYGINFHPDGNLVSTSDYSGVVQLWDIRTGKSIRHFIGHARRVLNVEFHPINGYQLASAGDDGTIRIWDIRKRKQIVSIPAHSNIISNIRFQPVAPRITTSTTSEEQQERGGEFLVSSSFDGTVRIWNTRNWKLINTVRGHNDGKITGVDIINSDTLVTCGLDKTLKMWK